MESLALPGGAGGRIIEKRFYSGLCIDPAGGSCYSRKMDLIFVRGGALSTIERILPPIENPTHRQRPPYRGPGC